MASKAGWQTTGMDEERGRPGGDWRAEFQLEHPSEAPLSAQFDDGPSEPMDQRTVEALLRRLVDRVEESERRYGEALNELHGRLDELSQTTDAARSASAPEHAATFDRLHAQVSGLAQRLESEPKPRTDSHLDDFERLGQALAGGARSDLSMAPAAPGVAPEPSPFAQSVMGSHSRNHLAPEAPRSVERPTWDYAPVPAPQDFDNRLSAMADRLEQSIGAAMPSSTIEGLNARLEEIGTQIARSLEAAPSRSALEQVEEQIVDMGRQLNRAEEQLGRLGGVEERLLKLLARLEEKEAPAATPLEIDAAKLQEIAAKAAVEAARLVADDSQKTTDRLEAMQRELNAVGNTSRQADDKLNNTLQSVHESLKQLVQQVERPAPRSPQTNPFVTQAERKRAQPAGPGPARPRQSRPAPQQRRPEEGQPRPQREEQRSPAPQMPVAARTQQQQNLPPSAPVRREDIRPDDAELRVKENLRDRLSASDPAAKPRNLLAAFERARAPHVEAPAPEPQPEPRAADPEPRDPASDGMVEAARRAAQAAAAQAAALAESRESHPVLKGSAVDIAANEAKSSRKRPYLIISAAILLAISALLLYGRLGSKTPADVSAVPATEAIMPAEGAPESTGSITTPPVTTAPAPAAAPNTGDETESFTIVPSPGASSVPGMVPLHDRVGEAAPGVTDIPKAPAAAMPESELSPEPQLASLKSDDAAALPSDVEFSVEEPATATEVAMAEKLTAASAKGPLPPAAIGSEALRQAAAKGNPIAQYTVAIRYIDGRGVETDAKKGMEWMERAARGGLAPAQYRLGTMFERGTGVAPDIDTARSWYLAAAERGNIKAMHNLAVSVSGGGGSTPNYPLAAKWYREAALRGLADSQFNLGILSEHGLGRPKDLAKAYKWYVLAANQGDTEAQKRRDIVAAQLTAATILTVDNKTTDWKAKAISREANEVTEPLTWGEQTASVSSEAPQPSTLVSRAQTLLNKLGYDVGVPDGLAGAKTRAGVKRFQERNGMSQTGEITVKLVDQLEALAT